MNQRYRFSFDIVCIFSGVLSIYEVFVYTLMLSANRFIVYLWIFTQKERTFNLLQ